MTYLNPKLCVHRHTSAVFEKYEFPKEGCYIKCDACDLQGPIVKVGIFRWWAVCRATSSFYRLANFIDKDKK